MMLRMKKVERPTLCGPQQATDYVFRVTAKLERDNGEVRRRNFNQWNDEVGRALRLEISTNRQVKGRERSRAPTL